jgi:hypothetical protein
MKDDSEYTWVVSLKMAPPHRFFCSKSFFFFGLVCFETESCYRAQAGTILLSPGVIGMYHNTWLCSSFCLSKLELLLLSRLNCFCIPEDFFFLILPS